jgi:hypothetical protein
MLFRFSGNLIRVGYLWEAEGKGPCRYLGIGDIPPRLKRTQRPLLRHCGFFGTQGWTLVKYAYMCINGMSYAV